MPASSPPTHPDLDREQAYLDRAYDHLAAMRDGRNGRPTSPTRPSNEVDSAIAQAHLRHRYRSLDTDVGGLAFGRLDDEDGDTWYVGRRHVEDERSNPVVVDWRAPVSTPFYRATAADPMDLRRRRRFVMTGRQLDDLFDEVFDDPDSVDAAHHGGIPDPLLAELERSRTGEMRDIVATIAAEQDVIIRAPLESCLVVQGGPGTGKTAVGLHRAAFLLYEHRPRLDREGVLVVGPNPLFLRYISQVLPSLGEAAIRQTTIERLVSGSVGRVRAFDPPALARLKGDARMALVLAAAARDHLRPPAAGPGAEDIRLPTPWGPCGCRRPTWWRRSTRSWPGASRSPPGGPPSGCAWPGWPARPTWRCGARRTPCPPTPSRPPGGRTPRPTPWRARCGRRCRPRRW